MPDATGTAAVRPVTPTGGGASSSARLADPDGYAGAVWTVGGGPRVVFGFTVGAGLVTEIELLADPKTLGHLDLGAPGT